MTVTRTHFPFRIDLWTPGGDGYPWTGYRAVGQGPTRGRASASVRCSAINLCSVNSQPPWRRRTNVWRKVTNPGRGGATKERFAVKFGAESARHNTVP